ncbi:hypothetical protein FBEOM_12982 [Fusarium beomiforme]|uniref:Ankyrin repeat domain-containing protein n=1 Tax=Fusarium beomiforme TaxID=44412 RepID=A0A9P5DSW0_9HYPO|nr:hypothetical protein FBEOM_12982 [Fusarium beomiforme]
MGRSTQAEQGRYGCFDVLSSCFKLPKPRSPSPDTPTARPGYAQSPQTQPDKSEVPVDLRLRGPFITPLVAVAYAGSLEVAKLLIEHGADVSIKPEPGDMSDFGGVLGAAFCGHNGIELVPCLIQQAEADPNRIIQDLWERSPWVNGLNINPEKEISKWLFRKNYLDPNEVQGMEISSSPALSPLVEIAKRFAKGELS